MRPQVKIALGCEVTGLIDLELANISCNFKEFCIEANWVTTMVRALISCVTVVVEKVRFCFQLQQSWT